MAARGKARKRALDILFEADARAVPLGTVLAEQVRRRKTAGEDPLNGYTVTIVEGVRAHQRRNIRIHKHRHINID